MQRGRELGYKMGDDQFKSIVENIRKENKLEDEAQFQAALKQEGMTLADLRKTLERQLIVSRVQQAEVWNKIGITDDGSQGLLRGAPDGVHDAGGRSPCARSSSRSRGRPPKANGRHQRRRRRGGARQGRQDPRAGRRRRGLRQARRRGIRCGLEGQRRPHRADQRAGARGAAAPAARAHEGRRDQPAAAHAPRVPDPEARIAHRHEGAGVRRGARSDRRQGVPAEAPGRDAEVPRQAPRARHHRVEERRAAEALRAAGLGRRPSSEAAAQR